MEDMKRRTLFKLAVIQASWVVPTLAACGAKPLDCSDTKGLSPDEQAGRKGVTYVDKSMDPAKLCSNCVQFEAKEAGQCGGCKVVKGPINPNGSCTVWAQKT